MAMRVLSNNHTFYDCITVRPQAMASEADSTLSHRFSFSSPENIRTVFLETKKAAETKI
jgi:hypothetical protein